MKLVLPIRTKSGDNSRNHWRAKATRAKAHRQGARIALASRFEAVGFAGYPGGMTVTLTRVAPRPLDTDGNASGMKSIRDGIADALGLRSDNDARVSWLYAQRRGAARLYAVEIEITPRTTCHACGQVLP